MEQQNVFREKNRIEDFDEIDQPGHDEDFENNPSNNAINPPDDDLLPNESFDFGAPMMENDEPQENNSFNIDMLELDFENLVRKSVDDYFKQAQKFAKTTDLDKRVREWQDRLEPVLNLITSRDSFNLHQTADKIIQNFRSNPENFQPKKINEKSVKVKSWTSVEGKNTKYQTCTMFASMLQLANNGNIEIITDQNLAGTEAYVDSLRLKLLTADRLQERFDDMDNLVYI